MSVRLQVRRLFSSGCLDTHIIRLFLNNLIKETINMSFIDIKSLIDDGRKSLENKQYWSALAIALMLPSVFRFCVWRVQSRRL